MSFGFGSGPPKEKRARTTPEEQAAIDAWLAQNRPTVVDPLARAYDATDKRDKYGAVIEPGISTAEALRIAAEMRSQPDQPPPSRMRDKVAALARTHTVPQICAELGLSNSTVHWHLKRAGVRARAAEDLTARQKELVRLVMEGCSLSTISAMTGRSVSAVKSAIKRLRDGGHLPESGQ